MRSFALTVAAVLACAGQTMAWGGAVDDALLPVTDQSNTAGIGASMWDGPKAVLFDNGPFVNSIGTGVGGADESIAADGEENNGFGCQYEFAYLLTDDFDIPAGETWDISKITLFLYQNESGTTSSITAVYIAIYDDHPEYGNLVYGDLYLNVLTTTSWTNCYRVLWAAQGTSDVRPIMANELEFTDLTLGPGTYYLAWCAEGNAASGLGPWNNPVCITGQPATGDSWQFTDIWAEVFMGGTNEPLGMPFILEGVSTSALEANTWAGIKYSF